MRNMSALKQQFLNPVLSTHYISKSQFDLIDYENKPDGLYKFILIYQDILTKFVILKPVISNMANPIAEKLLEIFLLFGAPCVLQSLNEKILINQIIDCLKELWSELKIVPGNYRENDNDILKEEIDSMLKNWMATKGTEKWSEGLGFVQLHKNRTYNVEINRTPFEAMFGCPAEVGLDSSSIPKNYLYMIKSEDDLEQLEASQNVSIKEETFPSNEYSYI